MKGNIVLTGMSGAGKSTLGVLLAKALGMDFLDTDIVLQKRENRLLQDIIDKDGAEGFLRKEEQAVCGIEASNCVIATGGSVVYSEKAMRALQSRGTVVYLFVRYEELERRLRDITTRGIVMKKRGSLREVYEERMPLYEKYGDITIDCSDRQIEACVSDLVRALKER